MKHFFLLSTCFIMFFASCKNNDDDTPQPVNETGKINLKVEYYFNGQKLEFTNTKYTVEAGYQTSFERLQYYISGLKFYMADSSFHSYATPIYADAKKYPDGFILEGIPTGKYFSTALYIGLDSAHNISFSLPATQENLNMEWPDAMGGGYHFLKLEGMFTDSTGTNGFAMHLGRNSNLVKQKKINRQFEVKNNETTTLTLRMNVAEWFKDPFIYDFNKDGLYSMSNMMAMKKIAANGADVFTAP